MYYYFFSSFSCKSTRAQVNSMFTIIMLRAFEWGSAITIKVGKKGLFFSFYFTSTENRFRFNMCSIEQSENYAMKLNLDFFCVAFCMKMSNHHLLVHILQYQRKKPQNCIYRIVSKTSWRELEILSLEYGLSFSYFFLCSYMDIHDEVHKI